MKREVGLLQTIATGGMWPLTRKAETDPPQVTDTTCTACGYGTHDDLRMFWTCPSHRQSTDWRVMRTCYLSGMAVPQSEENPRLWLRGLTPNTGHTGPQ